MMAYISLIQIEDIIIHSVQNDTEKQNQSSGIRDKLTADNAKSLRDQYDVTRESLKFDN